MARDPRHHPPAPSFSVTALLLMGLGALVWLGGLIWLAVAYNQSTLLGILLPLIPVLISFFIEQSKSTMAEWREDEDDPPDSPADNPPPPANEESQS